MVICVARGADSPRSSLAQRRWRNTHSAQILAAVSDRFARGGELADFYLVNQRQPYAGCQFGLLH
ncbi:rarD domain protein [Vibrio paracholerae]|nr:rarD domain protein [Vibrio paracholerae]